jgi:hypothetical protein
MNTLYAYVALMVFIFVIITLLVKSSSVTLAASFISMLMASVLIYGNHRQYYRTALWLHFILSGSPALIFSYLMGFEAGFYLYILVTPISILLFVDTKQKKDVYGACVYYSMMFVIALLLHFKGYEMNVSTLPPIYLLIINFVFTAIFITVLALTFVRLNEAYFDALKANNIVLEAQRNEIEAANTNLIEKNEEISGLVSVLNDKVKNNLQIIAFFTELDLLHLPTNNANDLLLLQKSRVKILDICYALIFEQQLSSDAWFTVAITKYYDFFKKHYAKKIHKNANFDLIIPENTPAINRKKFEMMLLMLNEWHFSWLIALDAPTEIDLVFTLMLTENAKQPFYLTIKIAGHHVKHYINNPKIKRLKQTTIQIQTTYDAEKDMHVLTANF